MWTWNTCKCSCILLQVLVAITSGSPASYFDGGTKKWERLTSMSQPQLESTGYKCCTADYVGSHLYVAVPHKMWDFLILCYSLDQDLWEELPACPCFVDNLCVIGDYMYAIGNYNQVPQRYNFSQCRWQPIAKLSDSSQTGNCYHVGVTVFNSKLYVICRRTQRHSQDPDNCMLYCFDPNMNHWDFLSNTCEPHFESTLFVVNDKLCVAGGCKSVRGHKSGHEKASVEVYDWKYQRWSVVQQSHITRNSLGAIEVEGRVYFIINKFPIDSGIRIPPGEQYPVYLGEWENLPKVDQNALLCYLPVKRKP